MTTHAATPHAPAAHGHAMAHGHEHNDMAHVASTKSLLAVFGALLVLTALTVLAAGIGMGAVDLWIAMIIATIKATLVGLYFMHLRYDKPFNTIAFLSAFAFVSVFIGFTLMDTHQYNDAVVWEEKLKLPTAAGTPAEAGPGTTAPSGAGATPGGGH